VVLLELKPALGLLSHALNLDVNQKQSQCRRIYEDHGYGGGHGQGSIQTYRWHESLPPVQQRWWKLVPAHTGLASRKLKIPPRPINTQFISTQQPSALSESDQSHLCTMHNFLLMVSHEEDFIDKHCGHRVQIFTLSPLLPDGEQNRLLQHVGNNPSEKNPEVP
jgi:hypothetical protein